MYKKYIVGIILLVNLIACSNPTQNTTPIINNTSSSIIPNSTITPSINPKSNIVEENKIGKLKLVLKNQTSNNTELEQYSRYINEDFKSTNILIDDFGNLFFGLFKLNIYSNSKKLEKIPENSFSLIGLDGKEIIKEKQNVNYTEINWKSNYYERDSKGNIYILSRFELIKITPNKEAYRYILGLENISSVTSDDESNIYISSEEKGFIKKFSSDYKEFWTINTSSNTGSEKCYKPINLRSDKNGNILFFDLQDLKVKQISKDGKNISVVIGGGNNNFSENIDAKNYKISSEFTKIIFDNNDNLYLLEKDKNHILKYNTETKKLTRFAGNGKVGFKQNNTLASESNLNNPIAINFDKNNNAYILDIGNKVIRKIDTSTQIISTFYGREINHGDGNNLNNIFFEEINNIYPKNNNLYISEKDRIRKFDGTSIETIAGNGYIPILLPSNEPPVSQISDNSIETPIFYPEIKYIDKDDNVYISENSFYRVISANKKIKKLNLNANAITGDKDNNLYISNWDTVRKIIGDNTEIIAGKEIVNTDLNGYPLPSPQSEYKLESGMNANAKVINLSDIQIDSKNNIYGISDYRYNYTIEYGKEYPNKVLVKITPDKKLYILAGNTSKSEQDFKLENTYNSKDPLSIPIHPLSLFIDKNDNLYLIDQLFDYKKNPDNEMFSGYQNSTIVRKFDKNMNMSIYAGNINDSVGFINTEINENSIGKTSKDLVLNSSNFREAKIDENGNIFFIGSDNSIYKVEYN